MKFTNIVEKLGFTIIFLTCLGFLISCSPRPGKTTITPIPQSSTSPPYPTHTITPVPPSTITSYPIATPKLPNVTTGYPITTPDLQNAIASYPAFSTKIAIPVPTALPTIQVTTAPKPEIHPTVTVSRLDCSMIDELFSKCTDDVLGIEFEIPITVGAINTTLTDYNVSTSVAEEGAFTMGHVYNYKLENYPRSIGNFENLDAIGWGDDFSMPRGGGVIKTKFIGCSNATICEDISPNILLTLYFPDANSLCDPRPGMTYIAYGAVVVHLPENPQINVFYFTGPTIIESLNDELLNPIMGDGTSERDCSEEAIQQFNANLDEIITQIEQGTLDEMSTQNINLLYHIAESIEFIEQP